MIRQQKRLTIILLLLGVDKRDYSSCNVKTLLYSIRDYAKSVNDHEILTESNRLLSHCISDSNGAFFKSSKYVPLKYLRKRRIARKIPND
ncbi:hypothetical protein WRSd3_03254 [Shigella dysenteriae WRSd3]|uniref:Uncharacterized 10.4 kDa protein in spaT 3'region n=4 Tax=Shigella TaxID=620 RepID=YSPU_SHIFL|nr:RecName: Full=Uncharacterized 10.4 kDa protein in spaT 3'region; AltName: Full=SPA-ORF11; Short=ORF-11 [Shigella flexneri]AAK18477.1 orf, hypothetical [Shigella flexneri 5a str. M90T]ESU76072.1 hypothetical protein WRSd3_p00224 [Shigella dysenteriae WRSd3]ESU76743.1 hypothetical protein WRSd5_p00190 [Shigella dysenteriae WRSd5]QSE36469.1 hypothetical protein NOOHOHFM_00177 [Shigella sonnei]QSE36872.1 hypothetical protein EMBNGEFE_00215 [Shigella flexneri 3a]